MTDLLEKVLEAHGGLDNWRRVNTVDFRLTLRGAALEVKQQPNGLRDVSVKVDARRPRTLITPFPAQGGRGVFDGTRVTIESDAGVKSSEFARARKEFDGHERQTPWTDKHFLYFIGYALNNYMTTPFLLTKDGVRSEEIAPHEEHGETWRVLKVTFPSSIPVHCPEQKFYFNDAGYLIRNDYAPEATRGSAAHYTFDHRNFDGFIFPTFRRVVFREPDGRTRLTGPSIFRLDVASVVLS